MKRELRLQAMATIGRDSHAHLAAPRYLSPKCVLLLHGGGILRREQRRESVDRRHG